MQTKNLLVEAEGAVTRIGLNRPAKRNALSDPMVAELQSVLMTLPATTKAIVIHGVGDNFCAGLDLAELRDRTAAEGMLHSQSWHRAFDQVQFGKAPVITVLQGAVIGGGLELAVSSHIRIAEPSAFYALPEGQRGLFVGGGGSVRLPRIIGVARMTDMMLTGRVYRADEAHTIGLTQYLVDAGQGLTKAMELAQKIAGNATLTNFAVMHALPRIANLSMSDGLMWESMMAGITSSDQEARDRMQAFLEHRAAKVDRS
jgi:(methylthio)acryloyl-CoA hydratase